MENKIRKWIFIGGAARSGTSLLQAIFNQHSACVSPPESHLLPNFTYAPTSKIKRALYDFGSLKKILTDDVKVQRLNISAEEVLSQLDVGLNPVELFIAYMNIFAQQRNKTILVEGTPQNVWLSRRLFEQFPGSYLLHIIRDPRDVLVSIMKTEYTKKFNPGVLSVCRHYNLQYYNGVEVAKKLFGKKYVQIFYEDLVANPLNEIKRICNELDLNFEPAMMEFYKSSGQVAASEESWKENLNNNFMSNNFGKWKKELKEEDLILIEEVCKQVFKDLPDRYPLSDVRKGKSTIEIQKALLPFTKWKAKEYLKSKFGFGKKIETQEEIDSLPTVERLEYYKVFEPMKKY